MTCQVIKEVPNIQTTGQLAAELANLGDLPLRDGHYRPISLQIVRDMEAGEIRAELV
jgi:hypothetical protein